MDDKDDVLLVTFLPFRDDKGNDAVATSAGGDMKALLNVQYICGHMTVSGMDESIHTSIASNRGSHAIKYGFWYSIPTFISTCISNVRSAVGAVRSKNIMMHNGCIIQ